QDGGENGAAPDTEQFTVAVTAVNDAPVITSTGGTTATEDGQYTYTASVTDPDDTNNGTDLTWSLTNEPTGMVVSSTGQVTWTPLEGVSTSGEVTLKVQDGGENGAAPDTEQFTVAVTAVNDAPVIDLDAQTEGTDFAVAFVEDGGAVSVVDTDGLSIGDADDTELESAVVTITNLMDDGLETLSVGSGTRAISVDYDGSTGALTLTGTASLADYEAMLRTVKYDNASGNPDTTDRTIEFTANDGEADSAVAVAVVCFLDAIALELHPSYNLLSLPFSTAEDETPADVLVDDQGERLFLEAVWSWSGEAHAYTTIDGNIPAKTGFWAFCPKSRNLKTTAKIRGRFANSSAALVHGWNLVGPVVDIPQADIIGIDGVAPTIWYWDAEIQRYGIVPGPGILKRGRGYWIYVTDPAGAVLEFSD
ncbi:MAG: Ig-like domain-containing protein, partial [Gemmatimonadales bacterium]|nr:Ig-like domain-containing protein [Gemmatimonadales bacterium]